MRKPLSPNAKPLSKEKFDILRKNAFTILDADRRNILNRSPFFGQVMMQLDIIPVRDPRVKTACTNGKNIYFDIDFLSQLTDSEREFILEHELVHNILTHSIRLGNRIHDIFNIAADMEVNELLQQDGLVVPKDGLLPSKYDLPSGLSAEEYYDLLIERENDKKPQYQPTNTSTSGEAGNDSCGFNSPDEGDSNDSSDSNNGNNNSRTRGKSAKQQLTEQFDKHIYVGDKDDEELEACEDRYGKVEEDPEYQPNATRENAERMREAAVSAAQHITREAGELPAHLKRVIERLVKPEVEWRDELAKFITRTTGEITRSWSRPNRRFASSGLYLPSSSGEKIKVAIGLDTSGSTAVALKRFVSEVAGIIGATGEYELTIIQCDTKIGKIDKYDSVDNCFDPNTEYQMTGGGGTNMLPIFRHIDDEQLDVDACIMFTDGYFDKISDKCMPQVPVLWAITKNGSIESLPANSNIIRVKADV